MNHILNLKWWYDNLWPVHIVYFLLLQKLYNDVELSNFVINSICFSTKMDYTVCQGLWPLKAHAQLCTHMHSHAHAGIHAQAAFLMCVCVA